MNENFPLGYENVDNYEEPTDSNRQWFFEVNGRFPTSVNELEDFIEVRLEDLQINEAEELAAKDLLEE